MAEELPLNDNNDLISNALSALDEDNLNKFQKALNAGVNFKLKDSNPMRIFERALETHGRAKYVKECLDRGCMSNYINKDHKKAAIHFAVNSYDPDIFKELLDHADTQFKVDRIFQQLTPLHSLAKNLTAQNATDVVACMKLLLSNNASPNMPDQEQRKPLHYVLRRYSELDENTKYEILRLFLSYDTRTVYDDVEVCYLLERDYPELNRQVTRSKYFNAFVEKLPRNFRANNNQRALFINIDNRDVEAFRDVLINEADPLYLLLHTPVNFNPFEKALRTYGCAEIVEECLKYGCKADYINEIFNEAAINYAADSCDPRIIDVLLSKPNVQVNHKYLSYFSPDNSLQFVTPVYAMVERLSNPMKSSDATTCMESLLKYGASPDIPNKHGMTPLLYVLKMRQLDKWEKREIVKLLRHYDAHFDIYRGDEIRHIMKRDFPDLEIPLISDEISYESLLEHLHSGDELRFVHLFQRFKVNSTEDQNDLLFYKAMDLQRYSALDELLQTDPLSLIDFVMATYRKRDWLLLKALVKHGVSQDLFKLIFHMLIGCMDYMSQISETNKKFHDYEKCFQVLLKSKCIDINKFVSSTLVPLKTAVMFGDHFAIKELLKHGAYISSLCLKEFIHFPVELLEEHFNNCITSNEEDLNDKDFRILMDYKNLLPYEQQQGDSNDRDFLISIDLMNSLRNGQQPDRIRIEDKDMTTIALIAKSSKHRHLLQHPLITSYLFVQWHRFSRLFYFNFFVYSLFVISFITYTILKFCKSGNQSLTTTFGVLSWIGTGYLTVREITQIIMSPAIYFCSFINYIEITLIVLLIKTCSAPSFDQDTQRGIVAIAIMLIALDSCLLVGSLPVLFISTHMMMLRAVCSSSLKLLGLFSILVFMFSLCFYMAFSKPMAIKNASEMINKNVSDTIVPKVEISDFPSLVGSIVKTMAMFIGEFDLGALNFNTGFSYVIFVIFVILMPVVLLNLLNGLAVYDTQAIKTQAELNGSICRANLLIRYENVLTENSRFITFLKKFDRTCAIYYRLLTFWCNNTTADKISIQPNDGNKVMIATNKLRILRNIYEPWNDHSYLNKLLRITFECSEMDGRTVKLAMAILKRKALAKLERRKINECKRSDELQRQDMKNMEKKFESELQTVKTTLSEVKTTLSEVLQALQDIKGTNVKETGSNNDKIKS